MKKISRYEQIIQMLEQEPNDVFLNYALAMEFISANDYSAAKQQLEKTLQLNATYLPCFYQLGQVAEKLSSFDVAIAYYKQGIEVAKAQHNTKAMGELNEALWMLED